MDDPPSVKQSNPTLACDIDTNNKIEDNKIISDVVAFSLCSLCSIRLHTLYPEDIHKEFRLSTLRNLVECLNLPERALSTIGEFSEDDEFTFLLSIKQNHSSGLFRLIRELMLLSTKDGNYDARSHHLIISVAETLGIPRDLVELHCESLYDLMKYREEIKNSNEENEDNNNRKDKSIDKSKVKKYVLVGLASLGGAAVMGVTGGLAAPVVASALAGVVGGSLALSATAAGVVGSLFGVAGAGLTASKMNKRLGDLEEFSFHSLNPAHDQTSLMITIAITGWVSGEDPKAFARPWQNMRHTREQYYLRYETKYLLELSQAMDYLLSFFFSYAAQEALKFTFLSSIVAAIALPAAMMTVTNVIDNPWDVCVNRSTKAGKRLADILRSRRQGKRPVSLIGFSLGARVIFYCLHELAQYDDTLGIISDVIMLGAPVTASEDQWRIISRIVSGNMINGYSSSDWLLKYLYRTSSAALKIAGLQAVSLNDRRLKNIDLTPLVGGHLDYYKKIDEILNYVDVKTDMSVSGAHFIETENESSCLQQKADAADDIYKEVSLNEMMVSSSGGSCSLLSSSNKKMKKNSFKVNHGLKGFILSPEDEKTLTSKSHESFKVTGVRLTHNNFEHSKDDSQVVSYLTEKLKVDVKLSTTTSSFLLDRRLRSRSRSI